MSHDLKKMFHDLKKTFPDSRKTFEASKKMSHDLKKIHDKFDRLDDRVDDMESNLTQEIRMQGAYLNQAFDMEGTILKKLNEIRFITKDYLFAKDLCRLLKQVKITPKLYERLGGTHRTLQYRIAIYGKKNFIHFKKIGFSIPFHKERFNRLLNKYNI